MVYNGAQSNLCSCAIVLDCAVGVVSDYVPMLSNVYSSRIKCYCVVRFREHLYVQAVQTSGRQQEPRFPDPGLISVHRKVSETETRSSSKKDVDRDLEAEIKMRTTHNIRIQNDRITFINHVRERLYKTLHNSRFKINATSFNQRTP